MEFATRPHAKVCLTRTGNRKSIWSGLKVQLPDTHLGIIIIISLKESNLYMQNVSYGKGNNTSLDHR